MIIPTQHENWAPVLRSSLCAWLPQPRLGPYEILKLLGAGGMSEVYKARDTRLNRIVAIKVCNGQFSERFEREAPRGSLPESSRHLHAARYRAELPRHGVRRRHRAPRSLASGSSASLLSADVHITASCGFTSRAQLSRAFRQVGGVMPMQSRRDTL
jgi:serine/threonine protein kinase